jgi:hypothetical protein
MSSMSAWNVDRGRHSALGMIAPATYDKINTTQPDVA